MSAYFLENIGMLIVILGFVILSVYLVFRICRDGRGYAKEIAKSVFGGGFLSLVFVLTLAGIAIISFFNWARSEKGITPRMIWEYVWN